MGSPNFNSRAIKIALIYMTVGVFYIVFSDILAEKIFGYPSELSKIQTYKGLIFVLVTALLIYFLILKEFIKHKKASEEISEKYLKELKQKNEFIQTVLDNLPIGIALNKFNEGHSTYMNKRFVEIYGWPEEELTDIENFFRKVYPDENYRQRIYERIINDINTGDPDKMQWENIEITQKSGNKRIVNAVNIPLIEQNTMVSTVMDVTEQKSFESSLKDSKAFITNVLDNLPVGISVVDKNYRYLIFNKTIQKFSDASLSEVIGEKVFELFPYIESSGLKEYMDRAMEGEKVITEDYSHPNDKSDQWFYSIYYPNRDADGNIIGIISQVTDITDRKKFEQKIIEQNFKYESLNEELNQTNEELYKAKEAAEESNKLKTAFLQNMSHEIRTPLNGIVGYADLLKDSSLTAEKIKSYTDIIISSSEQLLSIVTDIITISTIETRQERLNITRINLNELLLNLKNLFQKPAKEKGLNLVVKNGLNHNNSYIHSDGSKLTQIFTNLISNSIKFTDKGNIEYGYGIDNEKIKFFVKDSGIGIEEDMREKIFERFRQVEIGSAKKYGGTGLGLSISKGLVELLGGEIWAESIPGDGSVFYFTINGVKKHAT